MTTKSNNKDTLFAKRKTEISRFQFDEKVAHVFPDMLKRSVPGYEQIIEMIGVVTSQYAKSGSNLYDLGCSLCAASLSMQDNLDHNSCKIIAVDNSEAMIEKAKANVTNPANKSVIELMHQDVLDCDIKNASIVSLNFTLQFIDPDKRLELINRIYDGMLPGGALILSEKIRFSNDDINQFQIDLHHAFKAKNGYSEMEISQKRSSLEKVLIPDTYQEQIDRLNKAGFSNISPWYQCFNFFSFLAIK